MLEVCSKIKISHITAQIFFQDCRAKDSASNGVKILLLRKQIYICSVQTYARIKSSQYQRKKMFEVCSKIKFSHITAQIFFQDCRAKDSASNGVKILLL